MSRRPADGSGPSLLIVTTIAGTIRAFLKPFATHFRGLGWRVEAAANGATSDPGLDGLVDELHDLPLSRSILDVRGLVGGFRAIRTVAGSGFDIVHCHTPIAAFMTRAAVRSLPADRRPKVVYTAHGFHFYRNGGRLTNLIFKTVERIAGRWTDRLVVINEEDYAAALKNRIVPRHRLTLMPGIGIETDWYAPSRVTPEAQAEARARAGLDPETPFFAVVGELSIRKRPFDVVAALGRMTHTEAHLVLLGDGPERERVDAAIREADVADRVHFVGFLDDVRPYMVASTALVLASRMEGLPRCIMEALSLEVAVVASDARGSPDLVEPDAGLIVPVGDVDALARAMDRMLDEPATRRQMGLRGRERIVERYRLDIVIAQHETLYADLLAERGR